MKHLITLAGLSIACLTSANVLADTVLYGKAHVALVNETEDQAGTEASNLNLESRASRFGVKGSKEVAAGLEAVYQWESEVSWTSSKGGSNETQLKARNTYVGLKGGFGKVIAGIHDTPMKKSEGKVDLFSDREDMAKVQDPFLDTQERENNILMYTSPKFSGAQVAIATMPGKDGDEIGNAYSASLTYGDKKLKKSNVYAALAYDDKVDGDEKSAVRVVGATKLGGIKLGALLEQAKVEDGDTTTEDEQMRYLVSAAYKLNDKNTFLAQHVAAEEVAGQTSTDAFKAGNEVNSTSIGLDHKLSKSTKVYGMYSLRKDETVDAEKTKIAVGIEHKF